MPLSTRCFAKPQMLTQRIFHRDSLQLFVPCKKHVSTAWKIAVFFTPFLRLNWLQLSLVLIICKIIAKINVVLQIKHLIWRSASNCGPSVFFCYTKRCLYFKPPQIPLNSFSSKSPNWPHCNAASRCYILRSFSCISSVSFSVWASDVFPAVFFIYVTGHVKD